MSQISDFIAQARSSGKSDEIIRQELMSSGWQEADINWALHGAATTTAPAPASPAPTVSIPTIPTATVAAAGMSTLMKGIIALVVILGGFGGYFVFSKMGSAPGGGTPGASIDGSELGDQTTEDGGQVAPERKSSQLGWNPEEAPFTCADLFTESNLLQLAGGATAKVEVIAGATLGSFCTYSYVPDSLDGIFLVLLSFDETTVNPAPKLYEWSKQSSVKYSTEKGTSFADVTGVGAQAFRSPESNLQVLSSNQKYKFALSFTSGKMNVSAFDLEAMAKTIDSNLNKY